MSVSRGWFAAGATMAGLGVMTWAFGAHGLQTRVGPELLGVFETGVRYQIYHALALLAVGFAASRWSSGWIRAAGWLFVAGIVIFSGSLYLITLTGERRLGMITPIGGVCFILGWAGLALGALRAGEAAQQGNS